MKNLFTMLGLLLVVVIVFSGCALKSPFDSMTEEDAKITVTDDSGKIYTIDPVSYANQLTAKAVEDCLAYAREQEEKKWAQVSRMTGDDLVNYLEKDQWKDALLGINGKEKCAPGTNMFEAYVAYANAQGKVYEVAINETGSTLRFGVGAYVASDIAKAIIGGSGDRLYNSTKYEAGGSQSTTTGDFSPASVTTNSTKGEKSPVTTTSSTTEVAAEEEEAASTTGETTETTSSTE